MTILPTAYCLPPTPLPLAIFGPLDWLVVLAYFALMFCIGHLAGRKKTNAEGYFLGGRKMPVWSVALSVVATSLSVATFVGAPQYAIDGDLTYLSLNIGGFLAVFIVGLLFIPRFYRAGTVTIYGYIDQRYGETARIATSAMFLIGRLLASGARLYIAAIPVCLLMFGAFEPRTWQLITAILLVGAVGVAYTVAGGIKAVIVTDCVQILIVVGSCILGITLLLHKIPLSISEIWTALSDPASGPHGSKLKLIDFSRDPVRPFTIWTALIGATFLNTASYGVDHDLAQRMLTTKSVGRASMSLIASQFISIAVVSLFMVIGLLLYVFYRRPDLMGSAMPTDPLRSSFQVYPQFLLYHLPTGLAGLAIAGMFAAAQGSLDSAINAMASSAVADLYWPMKRKRLERGRAVPAEEVVEQARGFAVTTNREREAPAKPLSIPRDGSAGAPPSHFETAVDRRAMSRDSGENASTFAPKVAVALMGAALICVAIVCSLLYDPKGNRPLIDFALGIMSFAYTGMLGVFLAALFTRRGNSTSVLAALGAGVVVTSLLQKGVMEAWTGALFAHPFSLASFWWMPIGTVISFAICIAGPSRDADRASILPS